MIGFDPAAAAVGGLLLLAAGAALAQDRDPRFQILRVQGAEKPVGVGSLDIGVVIHGLYAVTTETIVFHNPNGRVLEGELEFPLPDGAAVSGFGLDVDGVVVDGVIVSKEKARVVLETEIRKGVDPGLAEQVRGNLYRARLYPIPARGTRTVRLRWVSELTTQGSDAAYHLPLPFDRPIGEASLRIEVIRAGKPEVEGGFGNLALTHWQDRWVAEARFTGAAPTRDLLVRMPRLPETLVDVERAGGEHYFSASALLPAQTAGKLSEPKRLALAWDASGSRQPEATLRELSFLEALLARWPDMPVDLVLFRDRAEPTRAFAGGEGHGQLLAALRAAPNDGGTALGALDLRRETLPRPDDALWIVASDGLGTLGEALPQFGDVPVFTITGASVADRALLRHLSAASGGELFDLVALPVEAAVAAMTSPGVRLLRAVASDPAAVADLAVAARADRTRATLTGRLLAAEARLTLLFGIGGHVIEERVVELRRADASTTNQEPGPVATAWAQGQAEALGLFADKNADALLALGRRFGLVTANTSLLVLETLEQHLEHGVEPAASRPVLRAQYREQIGEREQAKKRDYDQHLEQVVQLWQARQQWWNTEFKTGPDFRYQAPVNAPMGASSSLGMSRAMAAAPAPMAAPSAPPQMAMEADMAEMAPMADAPGGGGGASPGPRAKKMKERSGGAEASITIKAWDPQVPYLEPLRKAPPGGAYAAYLAVREQFAGPAFFLDCAELLLRAGERELGLRVLSNLAELRLDDPALLRVLAWRLAQAGELDLAAAVLEKVLRLRPDEPQSRRDLGLVLADRAELTNRPAEADRALGLLYEVVGKSWDRFPEIELIALMEVNRLLTRAERRGWTESVHAARVDPRLRLLMDVDLRVSLSWDADLTDVDLHVFEPSGEEASFRNQRTQAGGLVSRDFTQGYGPEEYLIRRAMPGSYAVKVHYYGSRQQTLVGPTTMVATVFTNWGRPDEKRQVLTLRLDGPKDMELVGVVEIKP